MSVGLAELIVVGLGVALVVLWLVGVAKLFAKGHATLGIIAIVGLLFPVVALVGFAGWFVDDRTATPAG